VIWRQWRGRINNIVVAVVIVIVDESGGRAFRIAAVVSAGIGWQSAETAVVVLVVYVCGVLRQNGRDINIFVRRAGISVYI
jgi:hypothetical protein